MFNQSWIVIIPPLLVVFTALLTRRVIISFITGIITGSLIVTQAKLTDSILLIGKRFLDSSGLAKMGSWHEFWGNWNLFIFMFLILLGILISLLQYSGASNVFAYILQDGIKTKKDVEKTSLFLSLLFFIDDYFSVLTVGSVMRSLARLDHLHPVKLAFLVTAMATPITILSPISSWVGEIVLQLKLVGISPGNGIDADPYFVFLRSIPFIFYAIFLIIGAWYIVSRSISFGPMAVYDNKSLHPKAETIPDHHASSIMDFLVPVLSLIITIFLGFLYTGNFIWFGGNNGFFEAIKNTVPHLALFMGGLVSVVISFAYFLMRKKITITDVITVTKQGTWLMIPSIFMLLCAWTFGSILRYDLHTGDYIAGIFVLFMNVTFLPLVCFLLSGLISCMIGSAWATIGIIVPIVIPMLLKLLHAVPGISADALPLLFPVIGATLSGAIMGTNMSLISDNPIMTAASTGANHYEHVKTMIWYVAPIAFSTIIVYTILGICITWFSLGTVFLISIGSGIICMIGLLELCQRLFKSGKLR